MTVHQQGHDEVIVPFDVADLETVASVLGAKPQRRLSPEHRANLFTGGSSYRFSVPETTNAAAAGLWGV